MKKLIQSVLLFSIMGLGTLKSNAQFTTYDRYEMSDIAIGNNSEHRTYHFYSEEEEFTILTDGYKVNKIDIAGSVEFCNSYSYDAINANFIPLDIASVDDKIVLLGRYKNTTEEATTYTYSVLSLNYDGTVHWEHIYDHAFDRLVQSINGDIMLAGIEAGGHYQLTEVSKADGSVLTFNSYLLEYFWHESYPSNPLLQLQALEVIDEGYFAIGAIRTYGRSAVTIFTEASSMLTTSKHHEFNGDNSRIYDIESNEAGGFYFAGSIRNGADIIIGVVEIDHSISWTKKYLWDNSLYTVYLGGKQPYPSTFI